LTKNAHSAAVPLASASGKGRRNSKPKVSDIPVDARSFGDNQALVRIVESIPMRTTIIKVDWSRLQDKEGADVMVRLAMVVNDLASADFVLRMADEKLNVASTSEARTGMILYAMKMQLAHLREAIPVVQSLRKVRALSPYLKQLSPNGKQQYKLFERILPGKPDYADFKKYVEELRHRLSFHYDRDVTREGIEYLVKTGSRNTTAVVERSGNISPHSDIHQSRLVAGDTVAFCAIASDTMWGISNRPESEWEGAISDVAKWTSDRSRALYSFGREVCTLFFADCRTV
jgi:hypothetical protein